MKEFQVDDGTVSGYLAAPTQGSGPGVVVLHPWWGLTEPFQRICDRLAEEGFVAFAPDLYHGKSTASVEEAQALATELNSYDERCRGDIEGSLQILRQNGATQQTHQAGGFGKFACVGFSLGGAYALDMSISLADEIAAVVVFYATYPGLKYSQSKAAYLCHFAEHDPFESAEAAAEMEQEIQAAGRPITVYTYPGTKHWFFEENRPEYVAGAAQLAWKRTIDFLHQHLG